MKFVKRIRQQIRCFSNRHEMYLLNVIEDLPPSVEHKCKHCNVKSISYAFTDVMKARKIKSDFFKEHVTTRFVLFEKDMRYMVLPFSKRLQYIAATFENKRSDDKKAVARVL